MHVFLNVFRSSSVELKKRKAKSNTGLSSHTVSLKPSGDVCRGEEFADVRGLSQRVALEVSSDACSGQGLHMQERVVTEGVIVGGVI